MTARRIEKTVFLSGAGDLDILKGGFSRLYLGHEFCARRLPGPGELKKAREAAAGEGMGFTLVTPACDEGDLPRIRRAVERLDGAPGTEIVVNDFGVLHFLRREGWDGEIVAGRLLSRQRRGAGWKLEAPLAGEAGEWHRRSAYDSPGMVQWLKKRYGVRRFELDNLVQGVEAGPFPRSVRLSVYYPYLILTATRLCPWAFDGKKWQRGGKCDVSCRDRTLALESVAGGGGEIVMAGRLQFLRNDGAEGVYGGPGVDRWVYQPRVPA